MGNRPIVLLCVLMVGIDALAQDASSIGTVRFIPEEIGFARTARPASGAHARSRGLSVPAPDRASTETLREIDASLAAIEAEEQRNGERSSTMIDQLLGLAGLYEQIGDRGSMIAVLDHALQLTRVVYGLYSLEQVEIAESISDELLEVGDLRGFESQQAYLVELAQRNGDDTLVPSILSGVADRQLEAIDQYRNPEPVLSITVRSAYDPGPGIPLTGRRKAIVTLRSARWMYGAALRAALVDPRPDVAELLALEDKVIDTYYLERSYGAGAREPKPGPMSGIHRAGARVFEAQVENSFNFGDSDIAAALAMIELGDWHLLYSANRLGLEQYRAAYSLLTESRVPDEVVDRLFSPDRPVPLPNVDSDFGDDEQAYRGYFDVRVKIGKYGNATDLEVIGASPDGARSIEGKLRRHIARSRFRPRIVDGELVASEQFTIRYYFDY